LPKNFKLENKWYPPSIFKLLSDDQRKQLKEWMEKKGSSGKRSVAAIKKQIKEELKAKRKRPTNEEAKMTKVTPNRVPTKRQAKNLAAGLTSRRSKRVDARRVA
jgi:hypothetical protein